MKHPGHTYGGFVPAISERGMTMASRFQPQSSPSATSPSSTRVPRASLTRRPLSVTTGPASHHLFSSTEPPQTISRWTTCSGLPLSPPLLLRGPPGRPAPPDPGVDRHDRQTSLLTAVPHRRACRHGEASRVSFQSHFHPKHSPVPPSCPSHHP
jgi:hypothetical protein